MKTIKAFFLTILFSTLLIFGACGSKDSEPDTIISTPAQVYHIEKEVSLEMDADLLHNAYLTGDALYYGQEDEAGVSRLYKQLWKLGASSVELFTLPAGERLENFTLTDNEEFVLFIKHFELSDENETIWTAMELRKTDNKGNVLWSVEIPDGENIPFLSHVLAGKDGTVFASSDCELFLFDEAGTLKKRQTIKGKLISLLARGDEGTVAVLQNNQKNQSLTVHKGSDGSQMLQKDFQTEHRWYRGEKCIYYLENDILTAYDWETNTYTGVLNFSDCGIGISTIQKIVPLEEEKFLIVLQEEGAQACFIILALSPEAEQTKAEENPKTPLFLASINSQNFQTPVTNFNRRNETYELKQKSFKIDQMDRLNAYLTAKDAPDVIEIAGVRFYHGYIKNEYLMEITQLLENSKKLDKEDFLARAIDDLAVDDKLYVIPKEIDATVLACPTELLDGSTSWTADEFLTFLEKYPDAYSGSEMPKEMVKEGVLRAVLYLGINDYMDREIGKAFFDSQEFVTLLKRIHALDVSVISRSARERAAEGEPVIFTLYLTATRDLLQAEEEIGRELTLIGYPTGNHDDGQNHGALIGYGGIVGIHSKTKHVDGAWDFVEGYISGALNKSKFSFYTGKQAFAEKLVEDMGEQAVFPVTQTHVDKVSDAFQNGTYVDTDTYDLVTLIADEAMYFFKGERSVEDVTRIIQNRIQLYLNEQS